jgi:mannose-6-phosphate isomerase-like protein (cupin superfamily)
MKVIAHAQAVPFTNSTTCHGLAFSHGDPQLDLAIVTVNGRYPAAGHLTNEICTEIAYVISGTGRVGVNAETHDLQPGDSVLINAGEHFYWHGLELTMVMACNPAFDPAQHRPALY